MAHGEGQATACEATVQRHGGALTARFRDLAAASSSMSLWPTTTCCPTPRPSPSRSPPGSSSSPGGGRPLRRLLSWLHHLDLGRGKWATTIRLFTLMDWPILDAICDKDKTYIQYTSGSDILYQVSGLEHSHFHGVEGL
ncbi:uncharacterized protein LOC120675168 [Panicum virgatum]|uniref:uncharacterized protein LOC120675168 n=1 Tax=Panicum virgatum TaxID=38727 RepID=UPI0019D5E907|nr:uncharacterized protein LOC120675168 [Panicum virgatum]